LEKAIYGCVEAAALWYIDLRGTITKDGFVENAYDQCVFNEEWTDGNQTTIVLHVDDLLVTNANESNLDAFYSYLKGVYKETRIVRGKVLDYVGMSLPSRYLLRTIERMDPVGLEVQSSPCQGAYAP
jgi:hypothetical protein